MATPVKELTYINGAMPVGEALVVANAPHGDGLVATAIRLPPPLWKPISFRKPDTLGATATMQSPPSVVGLIATKLTLFWRNGLKRPKRGQLWPRTR